MTSPPSAQSGAGGMRGNAADSRARSSTAIHPGSTSPAALPRRSGALYWRAAFVFLALLVASALFFVADFFRSWQNLEAETTQRVSWPVARQVASQLQPFLQPRPDYESLAAKAGEISTFMPGAVIFLVDDRGKVLDLLPRNFDLKQTTVDLGPIERFINSQPGGAAIYGTDPLSKSGQGVFSVAAVNIGSSQGYVYILFRSFTRNVLSWISAESSVGNELLWHFALFVLMSGIVGLLILARVTRRFYRIIASTESWSHGDSGARIRDTGTDEIARLGSTLDRMADTIRANIDELERKDRVRRELIATVSHDLRGPVAAVRAHAELLIEEEHQKEKREAVAADGLFRSVRSLESLISELFELTKLETSEVKFTPTPVSLTELCEDMALKHDAIAEEKRIALRKELPSPDRLVLADRNLLDRVLFNLVGNAFRHTPPDGTVTLNVTYLDSGARLSISDTGSGIAPDKLPLIFQRGFSGEESQHGGAGLGLTIVEKILELHGTHINVESVLGKGASFSFVVPYAPS